MAAQNGSETQQKSAIFLTVIAAATSSSPRSKQETKWSTHVNLTLPKGQPGIGGSQRILQSAKELKILLLHRVPNLWS
ncbi:hypothetical protein TNCV_3591271 [Trichonephila clavipes]|nr:hypothetical protein TNCV_3591271 [Trichonephila clavipes]